MTWCALRPDLASVELDQALGDGQPQAPTRFVRGARFAAVKLLEHLVEFVGQVNTITIGDNDGKSDGSHGISKAQDESNADGY